MVAVGDVALTEAGAFGTTGFTPSVNVVVPETDAPPVTVPVAVTVNVVALIATNGVPVISPVLVSNVSPAGNAPLTEYVTFVGFDPAIETEIELIGDPTVPVSLEVLNETPNGVVKVVVADGVPVPELLVATAVTLYVVPGCKLVVDTEVLDVLTVTELPPPTGVNVVS